MAGEIGDGEDRQLMFRSDSVADGVWVDDCAVVEVLQRFLTI